MLMVKHNNYNEQIFHIESEKIQSKGPIWAFLLRITYGSSDELASTKSKITWLRVFTIQTINHQIVSNHEAKSSNTLDLLTE